MNQNLSLAVAIVTYNRLEYLIPALHSAIAQLDSLDEIIVIDDGSTDGTREYLEGLNYPKLKLVFHEKNLGRPAARNTAVKNLTSDFLVWLDDDDILFEGIIDQLKEIITNNPGIDILYGDLVLCDKEMKPSRILKYAHIPKEQTLYQMVYCNPVPNPGTAIHRRVFSKIGSYNDEFARAQDFEFWARAALAGCNFHYSNMNHVFFRSHENNSGNPENTKKQCHYHCKIVKMIIESIHLSKVFPDLPWLTDNEGAAIEAFFALSKIFIDNQGYDQALSCIEQSFAYKVTPKGLALKGMLLNIIGDQKLAAEFLSLATCSFEPTLSAIYFKLKDDGVSPYE